MEAETGPSVSSSVDRFKVYDRLELLEFTDKYLFRPIGTPNRGFSVNREDGNIQLVDAENSDGSPTSSTIIYGVGGIMRLIAGTYVLVITSRKDVGLYLGYPVFQITSMKFLACDGALKFSTSQEKRDEAYFFSLLKILESTPGLYLSYETDITVNLQRRYKLDNNWVSKPFWKQADPRFVWNRYLFEELIELKLDEFIIPFQQGSFGAVELKLKMSPLLISLISRRCIRRLGTRMWRRGANLEGDTANFVESEQILEFEGYKSSFLQVRGSIPLLWEQIVDLSYKPHLRLINHEQTSEVVRRHFHDLAQRYGEIIALDLTDKQGDEGQLSSAYAAEMQQLNGVRYVSFDFHQHCGNSNFSNLQLMYDQISGAFENQGYFLSDESGDALNLQSGIIRSNCIDCLDRTNVTQNYLAQLSLTRQMQRLGLLTPSESVPMFHEVYRTFRALWADHGDEISLEYAGTYALKGDMVRYGRMSLGGLLKDGMTTVSRYYLNNFQDGIRQDALDLISGRYIVTKNGRSPVELNGFDSFIYFPVASALLIGGLTMTSTSFQHVGRNAQHFMSSVFWAGVTAGTLAVFKSNGRQFCSRPRLCDLN